MAGQQLIENRGTGGMITKVFAAELATKAGIPMYIVNGKKPDLLYQAVKGERVGTFFHAAKGEN